MRHRLLTLSMPNTFLGQDRCLKDLKLSELGVLLNGLLYLEEDVEKAGITRSETPPPPSNYSHIWVKTGWPYGIGILGDGEWQMDYGMSGFPVNIPFLFNPSKYPAIPGYVEILSEERLKKLGIADTEDNEENSKTRLRWAIFSPDPITL